MSVQNFTIYITSSGGFGHQAISEVLKNEADLPAYSQSIDILNVTGFVGKRGAETWNHARSNGNTAKLEQLLRCGWLGDKIFYWPVRMEIEKITKSHKVTKVINTQPNALQAILDALDKTTVLEIWMTDFPEEAHHFFNPIQRLSPDDKKRIFLKVPYASLGRSDENTRKWQYVACIQNRTGLLPKNINLVDPTVEKTYKNGPSNNMGEFFEEAQYRTSPYYDMLRPVPSVPVYSSDTVISMMLGSRPPTADLERAVDELVSLAHRAKQPNQRYIFFVFCGHEPSNGSPYILGRIRDKLANIELPDNLRVIPLPFQARDETAMISARSNVRIRGAGGASSFEEAMLKKNIPGNKKTFIWSSDPKSIPELEYNEKTYHKNIQTQHKEAMLSIERGNAAHLGDTLVSSSTLAEKLAPSFGINDFATGQIRPGDQQLFDDVQECLYKKRSFWQHVWRWITGSERRELLAITRSFVRAMDELEASPLIVCREQQGVNFRSYLAHASELQGRLKKGWTTRNSQELSDLERRVVALRYRLPKEMGGTPLPIRGRNYDLDKMIALATTYKKNKPLSNEEKDLLREAAKYKNFLPLLFEDKALQRDFFSWIFVLHLQLRPFMEYGSITKLPWEVRKKISTACPGALHIREADGIKQLVMAFVETNARGIQEVKQLPVLNFEQKVTWTSSHRQTKQQSSTQTRQKGQGSVHISYSESYQETVTDREGSRTDRSAQSYTLDFDGTEILTRGSTTTVPSQLQLTIGEIFAQLVSKDRQTRQVEVFQEGITAWGATTFEPEPNQTIDFNLNNWWEQLPTFATMTTEKAQKKYRENANGRNWIFRARVASKSVKLEFDDNHSFFEMLIPKNGQYYIYPFGRIAAKDPQGPIEKWLFALNTTSARLSYPDPWVYEVAQQHDEACAIIITPEMGHAAMWEIRTIIQKSLDDQLPFQLVDENCAKMTQHMANFLKDRAGKQSEKIDLFTTDFLDGEPRGIAGLAFRLPRCIKELFFKPISAFFLPWRERTFGGKAYSVMDSDYWKQGTVPFPCQLFNQLKKGRKGATPLPGRVQNLGIQPIYDFTF